jgi:hypothetical protein
MIKDFINVSDANISDVSFSYPHVISAGRQADDRFDSTPRRHVAFTTTPPSCRAPTTLPLRKKRILLNHP